jgi:peroxiredoxin
MSNLSGKTALVTGASRGIGRATALALAQGGAQVLVHYGRGKVEAEAVAAEIRSAGGRAEVVASDLAAPDGAHNLARQVRGIVGDRLDVLVAKRRKLSDLQGLDPMILVLSRGEYCPKDLRQAEGLVQLHREMEVGYSRLVTISTDNMLLTNEYRTCVGAHWTFLSDPGRKVQKDLDIAEYTDPDHDPMIPHVIVLEPGLVIFKLYNGYWFFGRPTVEELRQDLRAVLRKCRPDWDISSPELKAAWERGAHDSFYPYGKTYGQVFQEQE